MSTTLMQRAEEQIALYQLIAETEGELNPVLEEWLKEIESNLAVKVDSYKCLLDDLDDEAARLKSRADQFLAAVKHVSRLSDSIRSRMKQAMLNMGVDEVKGSDYRFKLSRQNSKLVIVNQAVIPDELTLVVQERIPDKDRLKELLISGENVPGARLEPVYALRSSVNKGVLR